MYTTRIARFIVWNRRNTMSCKFCVKVRSVYWPSCSQIASERRPRNGLYIFFTGFLQSCVAFTKYLSFRHRLTGLIFFFFFEDLLSQNARTKHVIPKYDLFLEYKELLVKHFHSNLFETICIEYPYT